MPSRLLVPILSPSRVLLCGVAAGGEGCHARGVAASPRLLPRDRQRLQIPLSVTTAMLRRVHEQVCLVVTDQWCEKWASDATHSWKPSLPVYATSCMSIRPALQAVASPSEESIDL